MAGPTTYSMDFPGEFRIDRQSYPQAGTFSSFPAIGVITVCFEKFSVAPSKLLSNGGALL
jgi:hypothetical protein